MPLRFIPAGAGNRSSRLLIYPQPPVHPRGCGEQLPMACRMAFLIGSSPRVRGTVLNNLASFHPPRFIPAGAGNRALLSSPRLHRPVHPRGCGEQGIATLARSSRLGSSPRVRGTEQHIHVAGLGVRFIPAGAGNSPTARPAFGALPVHPRGCGEQ